MESAEEWIERTGKGEAVRLLRKFSRDASELSKTLGLAANAIERGELESAREHLKKVERSIDGLGEGIA